MVFALYRPERQLDQKKKNLRSRKKKRLYMMKILGVRDFQKEKDFTNS